MPLIIACQSPISADPCQRPLDDPALGDHSEFVQLGALDDLEYPTAGAGNCHRRTGSLIAGIGKDLQDERPHGARSLIEHERCTVTILNVGGMNRDAQQEAERVDEDMPLAAGNLLARIIALRVKRGPPFCAALAL